MEHIRYIFSEIYLRYIFWKYLYCYHRYILSKYCREDIFQGKNSKEETLSKTNYLYTRVHLSSLKHWSSPVLYQVQPRSCKLVSELSGQLKMIKSIVLLGCYFKLDWARSFLPLFSTYLSLKSRNEKSSLLSFKKSEIFLESQVFGTFQSD